MYAHTVAVIRLHLSKTNPLLKCRGSLWWSLVRWSGFKRSWRWQRYRDNFHAEKKGSLAMAKHKYRKKSESLCKIGQPIANGKSDLLLKFVNGNMKSFLARNKWFCDIHYIIFFLLQLVFFYSKWRQSRIIIVKIHSMTQKSRPVEFQLQLKHTLHQMNCMI